HPHFKPRVVDITGFELPGHQRIRQAMQQRTVLPLPWNQHVDWANALAQEGDTIAQMTLVHLGVEDERLFEAMGYEELDAAQRLYRELEIYHTLPSFKERSEAFFIQPSNNNPDYLDIDFTSGTIKGTHSVTGKDDEPNY